MPSPIKYIIADDEALARDSVRTLLATDREMQLIAECRDGKEVVEQLQQQSVDLLWLDIQMPEWNGFEVLEHLPLDAMPYIIFVTAYDEFALRAFEYNTIDYLLKPYSNERFFKALTKAKKAIQLKNASPYQTPLKELLHYYQNHQNYRQRLSIKMKNRILILETKDILWIQASGSYLEIHTYQQKYLIQESLKNLEQQLDPQKFIRIHRSTMVNLSQIYALEPWFNGEYFVVLKNKKKLKLSRKYKDKVDMILGKF